MTAPDAANDAAASSSTINPEVQFANASSDDGSGAGIIGVVLIVVAHKVFLLL